MRSAALFVSVSLGVTAPLAAQVATAPGGKTEEPTPAEVPFGVGEKLSYRVKFGPLDVGEAEMAVVGIDSIDGHPTYHLRHSIKGGTFFYKLEDVQESWFDVFSLASRRFIQDIHEGNYVRYRVFDFDLEEGVYRQNNGETDSIPEKVLDDASFVYFIRTVPLEVGETYEWDRYFRWDRNPVIVKVLRRETVKVPAGEFRTIVVRPIIKAGGIYGEEGESEIYLTDDERRMPVQVRANFKLGSLTLELTEYVLGERLTPAMLGRR